MSVKPQSEHDATLARYLLGTLPEEDGFRIEEQALRDEGLFNRLRSVEDDLIDAYVRDELSAEEQRAFEERFSTHPVQRERVAFAVALRDLIESRAAVTSPGRMFHPGAVPERSRSRGARAALALAACLFMAIAGWLALENQRLGRRLGTVEEAHGRLVADNRAIEGDRARTAEELVTAQERVAELDQQLNAQLDTLTLLEKRLVEGQDRARPPLTVAFVLGLGTRAADGVTVLRLPPGVERVALQLDVEGTTASRFRALLRTTAKEEVWGRDLALSREGSEPPGAVVLEIPALVLSPGRYVLTLLERHGDAFEELGFFDLEVVRVVP